jgi:hypothetical protein
MRIDAFYNQSQPQILLEEVISHFVEAQEFFDPDKKAAHMAVIPS